MLIISVFEIREITLFVSVNGFKFMEVYKGEDIQGRVKVFCEP